MRNYVLSIRQRVFMAYGSRLLLLLAAFSLRGICYSQSCELYPIALSASQLSNAIPGALLTNVLNGIQPGNFGWLSWGGSPSEPALVQSLTIPGNSFAYVNPDAASDHQIKVGDWVRSKPGVSNSKPVRDALDRLESTDITVPVWGQVRGRGENAAYRVAGFAQIRLIDYQLPQQNRLSARFLGYANCSATNTAPTVDAGSDQTITLSQTLTLAGAASDDGLPLGGGLTVTWSKVTGPGTVTFSDPHVATNTVVFGSPGTYVLNFTATDSQLTSSDQLIVTVNRENQPPVADPLSVVTDEDTPLSISLKGSDPDNDPLTYIVTSVPNPAHGTLSGTPPDLVFTPALDFNGAESLTFKVNDGQLDSAAANVQISIVPVDDAPVADHLTLTNYEDTIFSITLSGSDVEGSPLTYTVIEAPTNGVLTGVAPDLTYHPATNYFGLDRFTFKVNDGTNDSASATVDIVLLPVDDPPLVAAGSDQVILLPTNSATLSGEVTYDSFPGAVDSVEWSKISGPGTVSFNDSHAGTTLATFSEPGVYELQLTASDSFLEGSDSIVILVDTPPIVNAGVSQTNGLSDGALLSGAIIDDGIPTDSILSVTWSKASGPGSVIFADPHATNTTAVFSESGIYTLRLSVDDGLSSRSSDITVMMNSAPIVDAGSDVLTTNLALSLNGTAFDDGLPNDQLVSHWTLVSGPGIVEFSQPYATNSPPVTTVTFTVPGTYVLRLTASDGLVESAKQITVSVDRAPILTISGRQVVTYPEPAQLNVSVDDDGLPAGGSLSFRWSQMEGPALATFSDSAGVSNSVYFPTSGVYTVRFEASDSVLTSVTNLILIANQKPEIDIALPTVTTWPEGTLLHASVRDDGLPSNAVSYAWSKIDGPGDVTFENATALTTRAVFSLAGTYTLRLTANDSAAEVSREVTVHLNSAPIVIDQQITLPEDTSTNLTLQGVDADADQLSYTIVTGPSHGTIIPLVTSNQFVYLPVTNYFGPDSFTYQASDNSSDSRIGTVSISLTPVNDAPSISVPGAQSTGDALPFAFDQTRLISISDVDAGDNLLQLSISSAGGTVTLGATNGLSFVSGGNQSSNLVVLGGLRDLNYALSNLTYTSFIGFSGTGDLALIINDRGNTGEGGELAGSNHIAITVIPTNHAPIIVSSPVTNLAVTPQLSKASQMDLSKWSVIQYNFASQGVATWTLTDQNSTAIQTRNADGSILLSDLMLTDSLVQGTFSVQSTGDDDFIGFVFGYQDRQHFYLFDWKQADQNSSGFAERGMSVKVINANSDLVEADVWPTYSSNTDREHTIFHNTIPWQAFTNYQFTLAFHPGSFSIIVQQGSSVLAKIDLADTNYLSGRFGFYNDSQDNARYSGFTRQQLAFYRYSYSVLASDPDGDAVTYSLVNAPAGMVVDSTSGNITWSPTTNQVGTVSVTVQATDTHGSSGLQSFSLVVPPPLFNQPPFVSAGPDLSFAQNDNPVMLSGVALDDGLPLEIPLTTTWTNLYGPGTVIFGSSTSLTTTANFSVPGIYVLQLTADDSLEQSSDLMTVRSGILCSVNPPSQMVAWWPGNMTGEDSVNGAHASFEGSAGFGSGEVGPAFQFPQVGGSVRVPAKTNYDIGSSAAGFTIEFWMNPSTAQSCGVLGWTNGVRVARWTAGSAQGDSLRFFVTGNSAGQYVDGQRPWATSASLNQWYHIALTYDRSAGVAMIYTNGVLLAAGNVGTNVLSTTGDFYLGQMNGTPGIYSGGLDEVSLYRRPLDPEEVYSLFAAGTAGKCPNEGNQPPRIYAGSDLFVSQVPGFATLAGDAHDDGLPAGSTLHYRWAKFSGPGTVTFANSNALVTIANFSTNGIYVLQLLADDGEAQSSDLVEVRVETLCSIQDPAGLTAWWPGNGTEQDVLNGYGSVLADGTGYTAGKVASTFNFDGLNDYVWIPGRANYDIGASTAGFTIEFWMNPTTAQSCGVLGWTNGVRVARWTAGSAQGDSLRFFVTGNYSGQYVDGQRPWASAASLNQWCHIALTYDRGSGVAKIYTNGVMLASAAVGTNVMSTSGDLFLGQLAGTSGSFAGGLDEISLYRRPLNPEEIYNLFTSGSAGKCPNDNNAPPNVYAGPDLFLTGVPALVTLRGQAEDDGLPTGSNVRAQWTVFSGPGTVTFADSNALETAAQFSTNGIYVLQLTADDGEAKRSDLVEVRVETLCTIQDPAGLAAWWPGNGTETDVFNGYDSLLASGAGYSTGKVASAFNFDGVNDYVWMPPQTNYNVGASPAGFSLEFWINPALAQSSGILGWTNALRVERWTAGSAQGDSLRFFVTGNNSGQYVDGQRIWQNSAALNQWYHIVMTYDRVLGTAKLFTNGVLLATATVGTNVMSTAGDFYLGQVPGSPGLFTGQLDEVSLYRRPLNPEEIYNLFTSGSAGKCPEYSNQTPVVYAGPDITLNSVTNIATLDGFVSDDGRPGNSPLRHQWSTFFGPGAVTFADSNSLATSANFATNGLYVLRLTADDGEIQRSDLMQVRVGIPCAAQDPPGLMASWPANGASDDVVSGSHALLGNGTGYTAGKVASAFGFTGSSNYVWALSQSNYDVGRTTNGFTLEFWFDPTTAQNGGVLGWANGVRLERFTGSAAGDTLRFDVAGTGAGQSVASSRIWSASALNQWYHIALTYDRTLGVARIYTNGALNASATVGTNVLSTAGDFYLGWVPGSSGNFLGALDEVSLYSRPLSSAEIQAIFNAGSSGKCISPSNQPPVVFAGLDKTISLPTSIVLSGSVSDDGLPNNSLGFTWTYLSGPGPVSFANSNQLVATATANTPGIYDFELSASDGALSATDIVAVTVLPDTRMSPGVSLVSPVNGALFPVAAGEYTNLTVTAIGSDSDGLVTRVDFFANGSNIGTSWNPPYSLVLSNVSSGTYTITAVALDDSGLNTTSAPATITVYVDSGPPIVDISSPEDARSVTAPTTVIGTASSPILQNYLMRYRSKAPESETLNPWITLATGTTSVVSNTLAVFDPTLMLNGIYEIQLTATDLLGRTSSTEIQTLMVSRNLKVGHFTVSFSDLAVPLAGVPIEIVRTYDSRDRRTNDFGIGWSLDIRNVRLQKTRNLGANWFSSGYTGGWYSLDSITPRRITVTLAGDKTFEFESVLTPSQQYGYPIESTRMTFTNLPGTYGQLEIDGDNRADVDGFDGYLNLLDFSTFDYFNPTRFKFTTAEGDIYVIDEKEGLKSLSDRNGNTLTITTNGIFHSSGISVAFTRDEQGRITAITDPMGNKLRYGYGTHGSLVTFTDRETNTASFTYTNLSFPNYLTEITDPRGVKAIRTEFDASGRMVRQIDGAGNVVEFTHDLANHREIVRDRLGHLTIHEYDDRGNVLRTTDALGNVTTSKYDEVDNLLEQVNALGNTNRFTYDNQGNKLTETDPLGYTTTYAYGHHRELTFLRNARGFTSTNAYDAETGDLLEQRDALGNKTTYSYDGAGNLRTRTDALGNMMTNAYDAFGRMTFTAVLDSSSHLLASSSFAYDTNGNQIAKSTKRTTPTGIETLTTTFQFDKENRLVQTIHPDGSSNTTIYALGLDKPAVDIDPLGRKTWHFYDERGNETNTIFADSTSESTLYDAENRKIAMTDRAGRTRFYTNDALGRFSAMRYPDGAVTNTLYDAIGRIIATQDERGNVTRFAYDPNCGCSGRQAFITNALGQVTQRSYDENGNESVITDAMGRTTRVLYDALDRRTYTIFADNTWTLTTYDALGRRIAETDQNTNTTWFGYDALGRLVSVTNALGNVTAYSYNEVGNLTAQTDANNHTTTFEYDAMGRRVKRTLPALQVETYAYDSAGNLTNKVDFNGHSTRYEYDSLNRLLSKTPDAYFSSPPVTITYTPTGQRATMSDASGVTTYGYSSRDWLTNKVWSPSGQSFNLSLDYTYDANGNVTGIHSATADGVSLTYTHDALNRLETATEAHVGTTTYGYDAVGNLAGYSYPNGLSSAYEYDSLNRLTNLSTIDSQQAAVAWYRYTVGASGHRLTAAENVVMTNVVRTINRLYTYDATYRLVNEGYSITGPAALPGSANVGYTLDNVGNRLTRLSTLPGIENQSLGYDANDRLTSDAYDANGSTIAGHLVPSAPTVSDTYDFEDHLVTRRSSAGTVTLVYDGDGNRVAKTVGNVTTLYLVDDRNPTGYAQVLEELETPNSQPGTPTLVRVYAYGNDLISQRGNGGAGWGTSFYGYDGHGNVRYLTDANGVVTDTYDYDAFGDLIAQSSINNFPTPNSYLYCGEQFDSDLGLYYNRARYLNTDSGRFWTRDPFEGTSSDPFSLHAYQYAHGAPVVLVDPLGTSELNEYEFGQGLQRTVMTGARINLRVVVRKSGCILMYAAADEVVNQGIYLFIGETGTLYVGKTQREFAVRLAEHLRSGALRNLDRVLGFIGVEGATRKVALRDIEQYVLNSVLKIKGRPGGLKGVQNKINPVRDVLRKTIKFCK